MLCLRMRAGIRTCGSDAIGRAPWLKPPKTPPTAALTSAPAKVPAEGTVLAIVPATYRQVD